MRAGGQNDLLYNNLLPKDEALPNTLMHIRMILDFSNTDLNSLKTGSHKNERDSPSSIFVPFLDFYTNTKMNMSNMKTICMGRQGMSFFNPNSTRRTSLLDLKVSVGPFRAGTTRHENKGLKHGPTRRKTGWANTVQMLGPCLKLRHDGLYSTTRLDGPCLG